MCTFCLKSLLFCHILTQTLHLKEISEGMIKYAMCVLLIQAEKMLQPLKQKEEKEAIVHMLLLVYMLLSLKFTVFFHILSLHLHTLIKDFKFLHWLQTKKWLKYIACKSATSVERICLCIQSWCEISKMQTCQNTLNITLTTKLWKKGSILCQRGWLLFSHLLIKPSFIAHLMLLVRGAFVQPLLPSQLAQGDWDSRTTPGWQVGAGGSQNQGKPGSVIWGRHFILWRHLCLSRRNA